MPNIFDRVFKRFGYIPLEKSVAPVATQPVGASSQFPTPPMDWITQIYSPGWPIKPATRPEDVEIPREIDYPISVNAALTPRAGYGLMPFAALSDAYENVTECRMPVATLIREMTGFRPRLIDKKRNELHDHPMQWLTESPDRITPFNVWMSRFMKSTMIFDAPTLYIDTDGTNLNGLQYVDGSTIFLIVDEKGRAPAPDQISPDPAIQKRYLEKAKQWLEKGKTLPLTTPAYAQVIKGTPFGWYDQNQIWYQPTSRRFNAPYGESFIEQSWGWVLIVANITAFELAHYREGNMPEGWIEGGEGYAIPELQTWEAAFNARMSAGPAERMRLRVFPFGFKWHETKKPEFPKLLYEQARDNICLSCGVPPSEYGKMPGQGLGGRGFGEAMMQALFRMGLMPRKIFLEGAVNSIMRRFGVDDATFELDLPVESADPEKARDSIKNLFAAGIFSLNDSLAALGMAPVAGGSVHMVIQGGQIVILEDYLKGRGKTPPTDGGAVGGAPVSNVPPTGPKTPDDAKRAAKILETGKIDDTFYSIPSEMEKGHLPPHPRDPKARFAPKGTVTSGDAQRLLVDAGIDPRVHAPQHNLGPIGGDGEALDDDGKAPGARLCKECGQPATKLVKWGDGNRLNLCDECFKTWTSQHDVKKVTVDEITEDELAKQLEKHCGVCPADDQYFQAPVSREAQIDFPDDGHANEVEVVAVHSDSGETRPALWKPVGGENDHLQSRVGGRLAPREEACALLDRSLGFYLIPTAYVATLDGEEGAVLLYIANHQPEVSVDQYDTKWIERAAVIDYISHECDRNQGNIFTAPDDPKRPILIDNAMSFPTTEGVPSFSPFIEQMKGKKLSDDVMMAITRTARDLAVWSDIGQLVGEDAGQIAFTRLTNLIRLGEIPETANNLVPDDSSSSTTKESS